MLIEMLVVKVGESFTFIYTVILTFSQIATMCSLLIVWWIPSLSLVYQILDRFRPNLVKIHLRMLILVFTRMLCGKNLTLWPWKSIGFQTLLRTKYVPSLVKIHWRILIPECSQECYALKIWPGDLDLWLDLANR